ncbi:MAG TPA: hypothetical protein VLM39_10300, partial [Ignavibacteriaceae bacterium]|nr:hypothetical protein [Ignavibacteriaceae bacterium]
MKLILISLILLILSKLNAQIIDSSNISYLNRIADGPNIALDLKDNKLYAAGGSNFYIFDISQPSSPDVLSKIVMPGFVDKIIVKDNLAFVLCWNHGVRIIDISNSFHPFEIDYLSLSLSIINFKIVDSILFAADVYDGLIIYDISDFNNPVIIGNYKTPGYGQDIDINGNYIYFADNYEGMHIFDISNPSQPQKLSTINPGQYIDRLLYRDNLVFAVDQDFGLRVIDVNNPSFPFELSNLSIPNTPRQITLNGNFIYMGGHKLHIIDISDVHHPSILNSYGDYLYTAEVKSKGSYVY